MKYCIVLFLLFWIGINHCFAQGSGSSFDRWLYVGITASPGFNFTQVVRPQGIPEDLAIVPFFSYAYGFTIRQDLTEQLASQIGIGIERYGIRDQYDGGTGLTIFHHLKVPLMIRYRLNKMLSRSRLFVSGGANFIYSPGFNGNRITAASTRDQLSWNATSYTRFNPSIAIGTEQQNKRGYLFSLSLTYTLGLYSLRNYEYSFRQNGQVIFSSPLRNRGTFLSFNCSVFLPPFGYQKLQLRSGR